MVCRAAHTAYVTSLTPLQDDMSARLKPNSQTTHFLPYKEETFRVGETRLLGQPVPPRQGT